MSPQIPEAAENSSANNRKVMAFRGVLSFSVSLLHLSPIHKGWMSRTLKQQEAFLLTLNRHCLLKLSPLLASGS
jgi:hypothetical protein